MAERNARQPFDADMNVACRFAAAGDVQVAAARRAAADENRVVAFAHEALETIDAPLGDELTASGQSVADLLVDDLIGQTKLWNLAPHHAAGARVGIEHDDLVADRGEIARDRQRRWAPTDAGDALAISLRRRTWQERGNVLLVIGGDAFKPANRDRLFLEAAPATGRLARTIACAPQNSGEHIRLPIDHVSSVIVPRSDLADIFGDRGMRRARPLTIDHFVEITRVRDVRRLHDFLSSRPFPIHQHVRVHTYANPRTKILKSGFRDDKRS